MGIRERQGTPRLGEVKQGVRKYMVWGDQSLEALRRAVGQRASELGGCELVEVSAPAVGRHKAGYKGSWNSNILA